MAIPIRKFGQRVQIQVHTEGGALVFSTDSLRIDFDVRNIAGWARGKFDIYNLAPKTASSISNGNNYVTVKVALHDSSFATIADRMYVSNAMTEKISPESKTSLFCFDKLKRAHLERQIDTQISGPTLRRVISQILQEAGYRGGVEFKHFPSTVVDYLPPKNISRRQGSLQSILDLMAEEYDFNVYTVANGFRFVYKPHRKNLEDTTLFTEPADVKLSTTNMRSTPKLSPGQLSFTSNLDARLLPGSVVDISNLLTAGTDSSQQDLELAANLLRDQVAGFSKYVINSTQHRGSNWTGDWITQIIGLSPTVGTNMKTNKDGWWQ